MIPENKPTLETDARRVVSDVLSCCAWWRRIDLADQVWDAFLASGVEADKRVYSARVLALSTCGKFGDLYSALTEMRHKVKAEVSPQLIEVIAQSASLSKARCRDACDALRIFVKEEGAVVHVAALVACILSAGRVL